MTANSLVLVTPRVTVVKFKKKKKKNIPTRKLKKNKPSRAFGNLVSDPYFTREELAKKMENLVRRPKLKVATKNKSTKMFNSSSATIASTRLPVKFINKPK